MRTDSPRISDEAMQDVRSYVSDVYSDKYLPEKPILYKGKKDAQDAHEAIRPTFVGRTPDDLKSMLSDDEYKLYKLIWMRFTASQMNPAIYDQTSAEIAAGDYLFRASGRVLKFDGFLKVYEETADEDLAPAEGEEDISLPPLTQGETLKTLEIIPKQHFTEPPPRYTEPSLVKTLEEKGIGRPSTYATILSTIQDREYVQKDQGKFVEAATGFQRSLEINPDQPDAYLHLAECVMRMGRPGAAVVALEELLRLHPENADAHWNLAGLLRATGRGAEADAHRAPV
jgi:DNA topoisomerase-1